jgi:uncharacterized short protein YbdD (DUF466 family)
MQRFMQRVKRSAGHGWNLLRQISGEADYDRYLVHYVTQHADDGESLLSRAEFYKRAQERKWSGVNRCC